MRTGLLRAGFTVAGLLEIHSEVLRHKTNGLTVSIDTLPQVRTISITLITMCECVCVCVCVCVSVYFCEARV